MIISASRRTDIPNYFSDWFFNRVKEGFVYVRNPINARQVSRIVLSPEIVDCIVFWTKNPEPMMKRLSELSRYKYYFQFTLTGYGRDVEPNLPPKKERLLPVFKELSSLLGHNRVIWRYDPVLINKVYTREYHLRAFGQIAESLQGYTKKCHISFVDTYRKNKRNMEALSLQILSEEEQKAFAGELAAIAHAKDMELVTCAEGIDLSEYGITHGSCIDKSLIESLTGCRLKAGKDKNQRGECGCMESIDIGSYHTCKNGCLYCYANYSLKSAEEGHKRCLADSPLLGGYLTEEDRVTERRVYSLKEYQMTFEGGEMKTASQGIK